MGAQPGAHGHDGEGAGWAAGLVGSGVLSLPRGGPGACGRPHEHVLAGGALEAAYAPRVHRQSAPQYVLEGGRVVHGHRKAQHEAPRRGGGLPPVPSPGGQCPVVEHGGHGSRGCAVCVDAGVRFHGGVAERGERDFDPWRVRHHVQHTEGAPLEAGKEGGALEQEPRLHPARWLADGGGGPCSAIPLPQRPALHRD